MDNSIHLLLSQPGAVAMTGLVIVVSTLLIGCVCVYAQTGASGLGNTATTAQSLMRVYIAFGRLRNLLCASCDRAAKRYPLANTCQIPHFQSLSQIYSYVFGYRTTGLFVEIGAYDGEAFSNTSGLADLGWTGHYLEPIPEYAAACARRHMNNRVTVHNVCAGERDGEMIELSAAGPFTSSVDDEIQAVSASKLSSVLSALGWAHNSAAKRVKAVTVSLNSFFSKHASVRGRVDVMVLDTEGAEWPILRGFNIAAYRPKLVIVEIQEKQARYRDNARTQQDAVNMEKYFHDAGYSILYRDVINTIFMDKNVRCVGGD